MATSFVRRDPSPYYSSSRRHPPPPSTPYLTEKILTLASSSGERMDAVNGDRRRDHGSLPPPVSPTDGVAQAMKNDLDELIGYIDNLAFQQKAKAEEADAVGSSVTSTTSKRLFPGDENPPGGIRGGIRSKTSHGKNQNAVFQDRTNKFMANAREENLFPKLGDPRPDLTVSTPTLYRQHSLIDSVHDDQGSIEDCPKMLEPTGNLPKREEPAGNPPPQEASLYFHDESLSLNLSPSQDADESDIGYPILSPKHSVKKQEEERSERPPRLLSTLQTNGIIPSPERSKSITFRSVSKDPTPSKPRTTSSSSSFGPVSDQHYPAATPMKNDFDSIIEDESEHDSLRQEKVRNRISTPFPHNHDRALERIEQDNVDRKGNEWWRVRSTPQHEHNPARRDTSLRFDSADVSSAIETNDGKSLKWEENASPELRGTKFEAKGTPHPSGKIDTGGRFGVGDTVLENVRENVLETPMLHHGKKSNLVLTSPESAKKLLKSAIEALQDARRERDEARKWADDIKKSVNEWVEDQRRLIRTESASVSDNTNTVSAAFLDHQHKAIEALIRDLRSEIQTSKTDSESKLEKLMVQQDGQIRELSRQLTSVKEQLSRLVHHEDPNPEHRTTPGNAPTTKLSRSASRSETSHASSRGSHRTRRSTPNGGHLIDYGNGVTKEHHPDGTTVTRFRNGDVETRFAPNRSSSKSNSDNSSKSSPSSSSCMVAYYHSKEEVLQITQKDGSVLYEYSNGQVERHCADGVKIVLFPDGTKTIV